MQFLCRLKSDSPLAPTIMDDSLKDEQAKHLIDIKNGTLKILKWQAVSPRQFVAWRFFDGTLCIARKLKPAPMPWGIIEYSRN